jgi:hypothetical protein
LQREPCSALSQRRSRFTYRFQKSGPRSLRPT